MSLGGDLDIAAHAWRGVRRAIAVAADESRRPIPHHSLSGPPVTACVPSVATLRVPDRLIVDLCRP